MLVCSQGENREPKNAHSSRVHLRGGWRSIGRSRAIYATGAISADDARVTTAGHVCSGRFDEFFAGFIAAYRQESMDE